MSLTFPGGLARVNAEASIIDTFLGVATNYSTIPLARSLTIAADTQTVIFGSLTIDGQLTVDGELRVTNWPS